jgi:hypothetical protein
MKRLIFAFIFIYISSTSALKAQDTIAVKVLAKNLITTTENDSNRIEKTVANSAIDIKNNQGDNLKVRFGHRATLIKERPFSSDSRHNYHHNHEIDSCSDYSPKFKGHWSGIDIGTNSFANVNYKGFTPNFMDLNQNKSLELSINFASHSIGLQKNKQNIGIVTGFGLTFSDYRFSNPYTIKNVNGMVVPELLDNNGLSKSKLSVYYLTIPILFEFQLPVNSNKDKLYMSGGFIGGVKIASHTKVKIDGDKSKDRSDLNINPFRYGATVRFGFEDINIFGTYYFSTFFKNGRGPEMFPFTIGIGLMDHHHR